jgi:hypothetical protein
MAVRRGDFHRPIVLTGEQRHVLEVSLAVGSFEQRHEPFEGLRVLSAIPRVERRFVPASGAFLRRTAAVRRG